MTLDEISWLLQTIEDPETVKRFIQAQYERGRITSHVMASFAWGHGWADWVTVEVFDDTHFDGEQCDIVGVQSLGPEV